MVDRITKILDKLSVRERKAIVKILTNIEAGKTTGLDIKKLKGHHAIYRVRKGSLRIIFLTKKSGHIQLLEISRRSKTTYRNF